MANPRAARRRPAPAQSLVRAGAPALAPLRTDIGQRRCSPRRDVPDVDEELRQWQQARKQKVHIPWRRLVADGRIAGFGVASLVLPDPVNDTLQWPLWALMAASFIAGPAAPPRRGTGSFGAASRRPHVKFPTWKTVQPDIVAYRAHRQTTAISGFDWRQAVRHLASPCTSSGSAATSAGAGSRIKLHTLFRRTVVPAQSRINPLRCRNDDILIGRCEMQTGYRHWRTAAGE